MSATLDRVTKAVREARTLRLMNGELLIPCALVMRDEAVEVYAVDLHDERRFYPLSACNGAVSGDVVDRPEGWRNDWALNAVKVLAG